jgi:hypothetical protein
MACCMFGVCKGRMDRLVTFPIRWKTPERFLDDQVPPVPGAFWRPRVLDPAGPCGIIGAGVLRPAAFPDGPV